MIFFLKQEALGSRASSLGEAELERMRTERRQLSQEVAEEQSKLDKAREERKGLEGDVVRLKMAREQSNKKLTWEIDLKFFFPFFT